MITLYSATEDLSLQYTYSESRTNDLIPVSKILRIFIYIYIKYIPLYLLKQFNSIIYVSWHIDVAIWIILQITLSILQVSFHRMIRSEGKS